MIPHRAAVGIALSLLLSGSARADPPPAPIRVFAAGSLGGVLRDIVRDYAAGTGQRIELTLGPAGTLLRDIEQGRAADLFLSANLAHPRRLAAEGRGSDPVVFTRNRVCVMTRRDAGFAPANVLDRLLDPAVRIGTSTPGADPGGDYAMALFVRADAVRPGAGRVLRDKARALVGGAAPTRVPGGGNAVEYFLDHRVVDAFIGYCSRHERRPDPRFDLVGLPDDLSIPVRYGMTVLSGAGHAPPPGAYRFASYLTGGHAQALLEAYGFAPAAGRPDR